MGIETAILGSGVLGAGASIFGSSKAAKAQQEAANNAIAAQREMFDRAKAEVQPFINYGKGGIAPLNNWLDYSNDSSPLAQLLKLTTPGADMSSTLEQTPGYQFSLNQGLRAVDRGLAARGLAGPGGALAKGSADYAQGLAGTTWQNVVNALQNTFSSGANSLQNRVGTGASAAGSLAGNAVQTGQGIANNMIGAGNAEAGSYMNIANAVGGLGNSAVSASLLSRLLPQAGGGASGGGLYDIPIGATRVAGPGDPGFSGW